MDQLQALLPTEDDPVATPPTMNGMLHIRVAGCSSRVDENGVCWYDLRFNWSVPPEARDGADALSNVLDELYFSVSRRCVRLHASAPCVSVLCGLLPARLAT